MGLSLAGPVPAFAAAGGIELPEPNAFTLLSIGLVGLLIGRRFARKRNDD